ncbi:hypothetical protein [Synechococcus sp. MIT S9504]|uniref:hypothetical protein n=1 Tax=Synechococcus sp. MIT S9504 TaxID=1801628 RepID=UPI001E2828A8|nr:hypothetical protein [Synechococcus sp. MIT S9504]
MTCQHFAHGVDAHWIDDGLQPQAATAPAGRSLDQELPLLEPHLARPVRMVPGVRVTLLLAMANSSVLASHSCP